MNISKCEIFYPSDAIKEAIDSEIKEILPDLKVVSKEELTLLGAPLHESGFRNSFQEKFRTVTLMFERLKKVSSHVGYFLLRNCLGIPKLMYSMRTTPTFLMHDILNEMDSAMKECIENILNIPLHERQWEQASLPVKLGGVGIRKMSEVSLPAFLASFSGVKSVVSTILGTTVDDLKLSSWDKAIEAWGLVDGRVPANTSVQKEWDEIVLKNKLDRENLSDIVDKARIKGLRQTESGSWLHAFPSKNIGTFLDNNTIRVCMGLRLGCDICRPYQCACGATVDSKGLHALSCKKSAGRFFRHATVNQCIKRALGTIDIPSILEPCGLLREDGKRPDGMSVVPWSRGQCLVWDYTCSDTFAASYVRQTAICPGAAAELAAKRKHEKYKKIKENGYKFIALSSETCGSWCQEMKAFINEVGRQMAMKTGDKRTIGHFKQIISLNIQRGNAASILGSLPDAAPMNEIFYL